ncbi:MAG: hypothetical protein KC417_03395 [Myxococcales bacterium]|nr:hypothetical protein [Myxococcales bacterium]
MTDGAHLEPVRETWRHVGRISFLAFAVLFEYGVARASIESLFLESHGPKRLPAVWIAVAVTAALVVSVYHRLTATRSLVWLFSAASWASAVVVLCCAALHRVAPSGATFALYVWKDVHVVVLIEIIWSFANAVFRTSTARWAYGFFCAMGSLGDLSGDLSVGVIAREFGTSAALYVHAVVLPAAALFNSWVSPGRDAAHVAPPKHLEKDLRRVIALFRASEYLPWLLAMILLVQVVITLVDYIYNVTLAAAYPLADERTAVGGNVYAVIAVGALGLQVVTGPILRWVGVRGTLSGVPAILGAAVLAVLVVPAFAVVMLVKVASKAFDYSVFRAAKELLYIPLTYEEKTRGKAVIDILGYRVAKGGASALLGLLVAAGVGGFVDVLALVCIAAWIAVTFVVGARYASRMRAHDGDGTVTGPST